MKHKEYVLKSIKSCTNFNHFETMLNWIKNLYYQGFMDKKTMIELIAEVDNKRKEIKE